MTRFYSLDNMTDDEVRATFDGIARATRWIRDAAKIVRDPAFRWCAGMLADNAEGRSYRLELVDGVLVGRAQNHLHLHPDLPDFARAEHGFLSPPLPRVDDDETAMLLLQMGLWAEESWGPRHPPPAPPHIGGSSTPATIDDLIHAAYVMQGLPDPLATPLPFLLVPIPPSGQDLAGSGDKGAT